MLRHSGSKTARRLGGLLLAKPPRTAPALISKKCRHIHASAVALDVHKILPALHPELPEKVASDMTAKQVIEQLKIGNQRFVENRTKARPLKEVFEHRDAINPDPALATIIADAHFEYPMQRLFDAAPGEIHPVLITGGAVEANDGVMGSAEFLIDYLASPLLLVVGHHDNEIVKIAVRQALRKIGRTDFEEGEAGLENIQLVEKARPAANDAVTHSPRSSFDELVYQANVESLWRNIELLLTESGTVSKNVREGKLEVHAAFFDAETGRVNFLGQHPLEKNFLRNPPKTEFIRTASCPPVPPSEALAALAAGNQRYVKGIGGQNQVHDDDVLAALSVSGQNPISVVVGCADSRAPVELIFDMRPGDLFILRNAGNSCNDKQDCSVKGSMDYALSALRCKLVVVMGHTQCGAVTAAVQQAKAGGGSTGLGDGIDRVLSYIDAAAKQAIEEMPDAELPDLVIRATELNVQNTMKRILSNSETARSGVQKMDVQIHGAIYCLRTGEVQWLGQHPNIEEIVPDMPIEIHRWKEAPYKLSPIPESPGRSPEAKHALRRLIEGNARFMQGIEKKHVAHGEKPFAVLLASSDNPVPPACLFDESASNFVVQRTMGADVDGSKESKGKGLYLQSLEFAFLKYQPPVFVFIMDRSSQLPDVALAQLFGVEVPSEPMRQLLSGLMVSSHKVVDQVSQLNRDGGVFTRAGRRTLIKSLTSELDAFYAIEGIIETSDVIRDAVRNNKLELHVCMLENHTGKAELIGEHPMIQELLALYE